MRTPTPLPTRPDDRLPAGIRAELDSFLLSLEAESLAAKTRRTYGEATSSSAASWLPATRLQRIGPRPHAAREARIGDRRPRRRLLPLRRRVRVDEPAAEPG